MVLFILYKIESGNRVREKCIAKIVDNCNTIFYTDYKVTAVIQKINEGNRVWRKNFH